MPPRPDIPADAVRWLADMAGRGQGSAGSCTEARWKPVDRRHRDRPWPRYGYVVNAVDADHPHITATCDGTPDLDVALMTANWQEVLERPDPEDAP